MRFILMRREIVLITGASSGIGLALAREFARQGHHLFLTARSEGELAKVAQNLERNYKVDAPFLAADLAQSGSVEAILEAASKSCARIDILVNNAGLGFRNNFWKYAFECDQEMIRVNIEATVHLTKLFLPKMLERGQGRIMNTASIAGFEPGPLLAVYHATKAFVLSFTEALAAELEESGITVTALCPGPTDTKFFPKANMVQTKAFQKLKVMAPQEIAEPAYKALMRGDRVFVPGAMNKAMVFSRRLISLPSQARMHKKFYQDAPPEERKRKSGDIEAEAVPAHRRERLRHRE